MIERMSEVPQDAKRLAVSEVLTHLAESAKALEANGSAFKCVAILLVDQHEGWAGAVGGEENFDLGKLLLTARDSIVSGGSGFTVFYKREGEPAASNEPMNGHDASDSAH